MGKLRAYSTTVDLASVVLASLSNHTYFLVHDTHMSIYVMKFITRDVIEKVKLFIRYEGLICEPFKNLS
jgi:hypothetical protein